MEYVSADAYLSDSKEHDIIFLDIEMGGSGAGLDGMGLAGHIRSVGIKEGSPFIGRVICMQIPLSCVRVSMLFRPLGACKYL